jgi:hypothetical protein
VTLLEQVREVNFKISMHFLIARVKKKTPNRMRRGRPLHHRLAHKLTESYSDEQPQPMAVSAPPRSAIVPEYDDSTDEGEVELDDTDSEDEDPSRRFLS